MLATDKVGKTSTSYRQVDLVFVILAPNVIVFERLRGDFAGGHIFNAEPVIPADLKTYWDMPFYMGGESARALPLDALHLLKTTSRMR